MNLKLVNIGIVKKANINIDGLTVIAGENDNGNCPLIVPNCIEDDEGYCVVTGKSSNVIVKIRALNLKKKKFKVEKAEASVSFTSFGK